MAGTEFVMTKESTFEGRVRACVPSERAVDIDTLLDLNSRNFARKYGELTFKCAILEKSASLEANNICFRTPRSGKSTVFNVLASCENVEGLEEPLDLLGLAQKWHTTKTNQLSLETLKIYTLL